MRCSAGTDAAEDSLMRCSAGTDAAAGSLLVDGALMRWVPPESVVH
jgi:hypothetical protein